MATPSSTPAYLNANYASAPASREPAESSRDCDSRPSGKAVESNGCGELCINQAFLHETPSDVFRPNVNAHTGSKDFSYEDVTSESSSQSAAESYSKRRRWSRVDKPSTDPPMSASLGEVLVSFAYQLCILVVDDDEQVLVSCRNVIESTPALLKVATTKSDALKILRQQRFALLLINLDQNSSQGMALLQEVKKVHPHVVVSMMSTNATVHSVTEIMCSGADDFLQKPLSPDHLMRLLIRVAKLQSSDVESRSGIGILQTARGMSGMVGGSPVMQRLYWLIGKAASKGSPVVIEGESGTGKELIARAIHFAGPNAAKRFIPVDCNSLVPTLIESELFGHVQGAFTGADQAKVGLLSSADSGTIFLDEIGELPMELQSRLLRALQEKEVRPVGGKTSIPITARIVTATNRTLKAMVESGTFRQDLYYRLNVVKLRAPSLRDRKEDIPALAQHILNKANGESNKCCVLHEDTLRRLIAYDWPGNIRELENALRRAVTLCDGPVIELGDLPTQLLAFQVTASPVEARTIGIAEASEELSMEHGALNAVPPTLALLEKRAILDSLHVLKGDKLLAAKLLGIGKTTLYRKLKEYGVTEQSAVPF